MIGEKKSLKKITMATGVVAMAVGLISAFSFEANAGTTTGIGGCNKYCKEAKDWQCTITYPNGDKVICHDKQKK